MVVLVAEGPAHGATVLCHIKHVKRLKTGKVSAVDAECQQGFCCRCRLSQLGWLSGCSQLACSLTLLTQKSWTRVLWQLSGQ